MVPKVSDFLSLLGKMAPWELAEQWDNCGLQVGYHGQEVRKVVVALDPSLAVLRDARERDAQLVFTHHPLIFHPLSSFDVETYPSNAILESAKNGIAVVAAHTNLDACSGGINDILAEILGLRNVTVLDENEHDSAVGLGRIGDWAKPSKLSMAAAKVKDILRLDKLRIVGAPDMWVRRVAVCGGSGGSLVPVAKRKGAELFLTGDVGHHHALAADVSGMALIDGGHFQTERTAFEIFAGRLHDAALSRGWEVCFEINGDEADPVWVD
jgi:dinuclear metal center YbgI/SA1388 family protein